mmetsp:Transcript_21499/g.38283  ORF Transcript_21499/g.38283 Transcript_21499/m.38283 type:complete len:476 (-) Transcript_21499:316-1743(-)|eukprot:CAMPEP_0177765794 /NCGR_PEP_ID=MMETSP0491_2-20121128/8177_1 /TAXON_ID=63592 /ORGANISM="Tetraselmis chuii, Strain PLY429" /LENGTH=475 /DNA_ID=CAMNT_0019282157 /DNA_START=100 /DNA_END=1527 /DNA_ORIENTATION=+
MVQVLPELTGNIVDFYEIGKELGKGQFGTTRLATHKKTRVPHACKTINKAKLQSPDDIEDVRREIAIMKHLSHPNIVKLSEVYEDKKFVHIVMEVCTGGELFDRIVERVYYSEKDAAAAVRTMAKIIEHCHSRGVIHRDLKPENFLLASVDKDAAIKATDFGLSVYFKGGEFFKDIVGSAYYVAPEVLRKRYNHEADIWSAGVILYILLSGVPPFWGNTEQEIFDSVLRGKPEFESDPWPKISEPAKNLVRKMLQPDPSKRITIKDVLKDPWLVENGLASDAPLDESVLSNIKNFANLNKLKKEAFRYIAGSLAPTQVMELQSTFKKIDIDGNGTITLDELRLALSQTFEGQGIEEELLNLMKAADVDGDGTIDYAEFLAATVQLSTLQSDENLEKAFTHFDADGSGTISITELKEGLSNVRGMDMKVIEGLLQEVDKNGDGQIDFHEFSAMMRSNNQQAQNAALGARLSMKTRY